MSLIGYTNNNFGGGSMTYDDSNQYTGNSPGGWSDRISSFKITDNGAWVLCKNSNCTGTGSDRFGPFMKGDYPAASAVACNDCISAVVKFPDYGTAKCWLNPQLAACQPGAGGVTGNGKSGGVSGLSTPMLLGIGGVVLLAIVATIIIIVVAKK